MKEHKKLLIAVLLIVLTAGAAAGTYAYTTRAETAHNIITTASGVRAEIVEYAADPEHPGQLIPYEDPESVMPSETVSKIPVVANSGSTAFYTRMKVVRDIQLAEGKEGEPSADRIILRYHGADGFNTADWTDGGDGYWYYNKPVTAGQETAPLFDEVAFDGELGDLYQGSTAHVSIQAQAVQSDNNSESPLTAEGWPEAK